MEALPPQLAGEAGPPEEPKRVAHVPVSGAFSSSSGISRAGEMASRAGERPRIISLSCLFLVEVLHEIVVADVRFDAVWRHVTLDHPN